METPVNAPLKEKIRIEKANLREMDFKGKLDHIWEYYKLFIIGFIVIIIILGSLINTWFINPPPKTVLYIAWSAGFAFDEQLSELTGSLKERVIDETRNETVVVSQLYLAEDEPSMMMANTNRLAAMVAAGEIDLFVLDFELLDEFTGNGIIAPMESILEKIKETYPHVYDKIVDKSIHMQYESDEGNTVDRIMGISIKECPLFSEIGFFEQDLYLSVSVTSQNFVNVINAVALFFE